MSDNFNQCRVMQQTDAHFPDMYVLHSALKTCLPSLIYPWRILKNPRVMLYFHRDIFASMHLVNIFSVNCDSFSIASPTIYLTYLSVVYNLQHIVYRLTVRPDLLACSFDQLHRSSPATACIESFTRWMSLQTMASQRTSGWRGPIQNKHGAAQLPCQVSQSIAKVWVGDLFWNQLHMEANVP